jgi:hypothetical protein
MRIIALTIALALALPGCSKPANKAPKDFSAYLHLQPGTRIKVTPLIAVEGPSTGVLDKTFKQVEQDMVVTGTLTSITKDELSLRPDKPNQVVGFSPAGVRSIEVLDPAK